MSSAGLTFPAELQLLLAEQLLDERRAGALEAFRIAEQYGGEPNRCAAGRWMAHMLSGNFEEAWRESDAIRARGTFDPHRLWDGEPLNGHRVIVRCLHGLGDAIQFLRYAAALRQIVAELVVEVPPRLLDLAPLIEGVDRAVSWGKYAPDAPVMWDKQIEVMELPYYFRTTLSDLPLAEKYVRVPHEMRKLAERAMGKRDRPRVGLVWAAGDWNPSRSIPIAEVSRLLDVDGCEFWNLQDGSERSGSVARTEGRLRDVNECGEGLLALAAVISELDLVITVDTLAAHLTGALGKPAWVLLQHAADWRWMMDRSDSPWYPTLRLFRQICRKDWSEVISAVRDELRLFLNRSETASARGGLL